MHLSHVSQAVLQGCYGKMDCAVIEATEVTPDGRVFLTTSIGSSPAYLQYAEKVIIELNAYHSPRLREMADIVIVPPPPHRKTIPILGPMTKIGWPYACVDPRKILGVVHTNEPDEIDAFSPAGEISRKIADNVVRFMVEEMAAERMPREFLPLQSGVGDVANAVMHSLGTHPDIPPFTMFTEVFQDACVDLMEKGRLAGASCTSLTVTPTQLRRIYDNMDFYAPRIVLRPMEISNNPGLSRRLGVITMNTALEVDIYGHVNSTHVGGTQIMNGSGGSGDFMRNGFISFFMCPSVAKGGRISTIVPMCTHVDHNEHSVQIVVTEHGLADLRGLAPVRRAKKSSNTARIPPIATISCTIWRTRRKATSGMICPTVSRCISTCNRRAKCFPTSISGSLKKTERVGRKLTPLAGFQGFYLSTRLTACRNTQSSAVGANSLLK